MLVDDKLYFGCGTFKNVFKQLTANPKVEVLAVNGGEFMRYIQILQDARICRNRKGGNKHEG